ncbi:hypothetical protein Pan258_02220 [Symmachiella dynata]|nr:hypothetical protein Pan258_02220 [Symmachiella dynata]
MDTLTLRQHQRPLYQVQPHKSHPRLSARRVLYGRFLKWLDGASAHALKKLIRRTLGFLAIASYYAAPQFTLGFLSGIATWNGYRIPLFIISILIVTHSSTLIRFLRRPKRNGANQYVFHGVPVGELASFLKQHESFKHDDAIRKLGLSQGQHTKIAQELEQHGILCRGENNARVLRDIPMEDLVRQLRDGFPLVWSDERQVWAERNGTFDRWCLNQDFKRRKLKEEIERKERKKKRLQKQIERDSILTDMFA